MNSKKTIEESCQRLLQYMEKAQFRGYDPYDGLESPLWKIPVLNDSNKLQFLFQQFVKRFPVNIRPLLFIQKGKNPVTIGLALQSYCALYTLSNDNQHLLKAKEMLRLLYEMRSKGFSGDCWGYDFKWSSRYATIPYGKPTVVATGIIINAVYQYWKLEKDPAAESLILGAADFVTKDLNRTKSIDDSFCFSYSPFDHEQVYNASLKGSRILAQAYSIHNNEEWKKLIYLSCRWVINKQGSDGSWRYSESKAGSKCDNYHTGYVLDCLAECIELADLYEFKVPLTKGRQYYEMNFFEPDGQPKFYDDEIWPADCTAGGQSILSLLKMNKPDAACKIALWMINNMQSDKGYFYFRKYKYHTEKTSFMRWSNAWMLAALSTLIAYSPSESKGLKGANMKI